MNYYKRSNLPHSKSNTQLYRIKLIVVLIITFGTVVISCDKENDNILKDEYYVKYIVNSSTAYVDGGKSLSRTAQITLENNANKSFIFNNSTWETTIGPVKKEFHASLSARFNASNVLGGRPERTYISVEIQVSKNNGPFALKASNISTQERFSASTKYMISD